jgi:hypothetical protein
VVFFVANFLAIFAKDIWEKEILSQNSLCFLWKTNRQKRRGEKKSPKITTIAYI